MITPFTLAWYIYKCYQVTSWWGPLACFLFFLVGSIINNITMPVVVRESKKVEAFEVCSLEFFCSSKIKRNKKRAIIVGKMLGYDTRPSQWPCQGRPNASLEQPLNEQIRYLVSKLNQNSIGIGFYFTFKKQLFKKKFLHRNSCTNYDFKKLSNRK